MANAISASGFSTIIGAIYDCAIDPARWPSTLRLICERLDFVNAVLAVQPLPTGRTLLSASTGIAPPFLERLSEFGSDVIEQWGGRHVALTLPLDEPAVLSRVNPAACAAGRDDRYYREWRRPQGLVDTLNLMLVREPDAIGTLSFGRHEDVGLISDREIGLARLLLPHCQRAVAISRMLEVRTLEAASLRDVLDTLSTPIVLTGADLEIVHANLAARELMGRPGAVRAEKGILSTGSAPVTAALRAAVRNGLADTAEHTAPRLAQRDAAAVTSDSHAFFVMPLRVGALRPAVFVGATAAIFIRPRAQAAVVEGDQFAQIFGLTPAETRVFEQVAAGRTPSETAAALNLRSSTVRTHLLRVFDKTGARRQSELVALVAAMAPPTIRRSTSS